MDVNFETIINTASTFNAFRNQHAVPSLMEPGLMVWNDIDQEDAKNLLRVKESVETLVRSDVAKVCTNFLMKTYALTLDKQDPEVVDLIQLRGNSVFAQYSNTVSMETADFMTSKKKFMPNIAEITECLGKISADQDSLFSKARAASAIIEPSSFDQADNLCDRMKSVLPLIMGMDAFVSWGPSMLEFRYFANTKTVIVGGKSPFYVDYLRRFEGSIVKAAQVLGLNALCASFKLLSEINTVDERF